LEQWAKTNGQDPRHWVRASGDSVHLRTPINGRPENGFVQTDFMFMPNLDWGQFFLAGGADSDYKGVYRNVLMSSIGKPLGVKVSAKGVTSRETNNVVTMDPDYAAEILLGPGNTRENLKNVESIYQALSRDPDKDAKLADFRGYIARDAIHEPTPMNESDVGFMARLRDRIVNQGMQVIIEGVRIEHPEDMVFDMGSNGLSQAVAGIVAAAKNPESTTVKWDGRPAIVFGRKPTGEFVLTDKSGFLAKGYDGLATSPEMLAQIMAMRSGERSELIAMYQKIFPFLRRAVPQNFRGYVQGDLMWTSTPPVVNNAYEFMPNTVKYRVAVDSPMGKAIGQSQVGLVIHTYLEQPGAEPTPIQAANLAQVPGLVILDPSLKTSGAVQLSAKRVQTVQQIVQKYGAAIDRLFNPAELRARKITNTPALIKTYINTKVREGNYNNLLGGFVQWVNIKEPAKAPRVLEWLQENKQAVAALFQAFLELSALKNELVRQLDAQGQDVQASVNNEPGHEGYVGHGMKFVDRMRFSQANFARNNPDVE
jgi:hypothetical protein